MRAILLVVFLAATTQAQSWDLAPSDFLRYERRKVTRKGGKEKFGAGAIITVYGHDLRAEGQYQPVDVRRNLLQQIFAFRTKGGTLKLPIADTITLKCTGTVEAGAKLLAGNWRFASRGKEARGNKFKIQNGTAHVRAEFDGGVVKSARVTLEYLRRKLNPKPREKPHQVFEEWDFRLVQTRRVGSDMRTEINKAIDLGVKRLREWQKDDGSFEPHGKWEIGSTALALLTLVACDVPRDDPVVVKALNNILKTPPRRTYERACVLMAIERLYTPPGEIHAARRVKKLVRNLPPATRAFCAKIAADLETECTTPGSWGYPTKAGLLIRLDSSNTQYAVLGLRAASRMGLPVKANTWLGVVRHFKLHRERKGPRGEVALIREGQAIKDQRDKTRGLVKVPSVAGFKYNTYSKSVWGSMTCAGIASLLVVRDELTKLGKLTPKVDRDIKAMVLGAWAWLDRNWGMDRHPHKNNWYYYYLYALERAGIFDRVKRVGAKDWYFEGACQLLARQQKKGHWPETGKGDMVKTCFALLFLKRAAAPLTQSK